MKNRSIRKIKESRDYLSPLGNINHRALFGGYSLSIDNTVFAMVAEGELYLRACEDTAAYFCQKPPAMLSFNKQGRAVLLQYYRVDESLWRDRPSLLHLSRQALHHARNEKITRNMPQRLKDLPNLSLRIEVLLHQVGIDDARTLRNLGARVSWLKLYLRHRFVGVNTLYALEGAITGTHMAALPAERRRELSDWCMQQRMTDELNQEADQSDAASE